MSNFDEKLAAIVKHGNETFEQGQLNGSLTVINRLISESIEHKYTDINQLMGAIINISDELRGDMTSEQYEADAKADHRTDV